MKRSLMLFAIGSMSSLVILTSSYGQLRLNLPDMNQQGQQQYQSNSGQPGGFGNIVGSRVYDRDGNMVGTLSSVVTDPQSGQPMYGVISTGGILGFGAESHPVPWQLFNVNENGVRLNLNEDRLRKSPNFSSEDRPDLMSDRWQRRLSDYFGVQPMAGGYGGSQGYTSGQDPFQRLFNRDDMSNIRGTVTRVFHHMQGDLTQVALRTDDGRSVMAVLAPEQYLQNYNAIPREGDNIRVRGSRVFQNGREFIVATTVNTDNQRLQIRNNDGMPLWTQQQPYGDQDRYQRGY